VIAAERVREAFADSGIVVEDGPVDTPSASVWRAAAGTELEVLLAAADSALYQASAMAESRRGSRGTAAVAGKMAAKDAGSGHERQPPGVVSPT